MDELDIAYKNLEREVPTWMGRILRWLNSPRARFYRIPIGIFLIACGLVGFLPIVGYEFIPLGLLVLALDIPFLRKPVGKFILWLLKKWQEFKQKRTERKSE